MFMDELLDGNAREQQLGRFMCTSVWICVSACMKMDLGAEGNAQLCIKPPEFAICGH